MFIEITNFVYDLVLFLPALPNTVLTMTHMLDVHVLMSYVHVL